MSNDVTHRRRIPRWLARLSGTVMVAVALVFIVWGIFGNPGQTRPSVTAEMAGIDQRFDAQVPADAAFRDESGKGVRLGDYFSDRPGARPIVLNLVYFQCPMLCQRVIESFVRTLRTMELTVGEDFDVLTVSFDPREGPELAAALKASVLGQYERAAAAGGWHFLTGEEPAIQRLTEAVGFRYTYDEQTKQYAHGATIIVLTPEGRVSRYLNGVDYPARNVRLAVVEASDRRIGKLQDTVLLLCFQYDPTKGRYGLAIINLMRAAGIATVLAMAIGIGVMLRRERRAVRGIGLPPVDTD